MASIYKKLKKFMLDYCKDYNRYANDEETIDKMDDYWAADLNVVAYFHREDGTYPVIYPSRQAFKDFLVITHRLVKDSLNPIDVIVDE
ncbi:MAG: hypothetical protein GY950_15600, partial [bacterium]|nr:hypothetical protein [bacterium]